MEEKKPPRITQSITNITRQTAWERSDGLNKKEKPPKETNGGWGESSTANYICE